MANYEIYEDDGTTPIAIAQPQRATWEAASLGRFADGSPRTSRYRTVVWQFGLLSEAQYQVFLANRPDDGSMSFKTYVAAHGGTPAAWVKCTGIMEPIATGNLRDGEYSGVQITWTRVATV